MFGISLCGIRVLSSMQVKGCSHGEVSSSASDVGPAACMSQALRPWLLQCNSCGTAQAVELLLEG